LVVKRKLTPEAGDWLVRHITKEEVKATIFKLHPEKSPGPDGFPAGFFQKNCALVGKDNTEAVLSFFTSGKLIKKRNHTFITLVHKSANAFQLRDYRPISYCNTLYQ